MTERRRDDVVEELFQEEYDGLLRLAYPGMRFRNSFSARFG